MEIRNKILCVLGAPLLMMGAAIIPVQAAETQGFLHVNGLDIVDQAGNKFFI